MAKRARGKVWLKGKPFHNVDQTEAHFLSAANKAVVAKIRAFQQVQGARALETKHPQPRLSKPSQMNKMPAVELELSKSGNVNQKDVTVAESSFIRMIIYDICFEEEEVCS